VLVAHKRDSYKEAVVVTPTVRVCISSLFTPQEIAFIAQAVRSAVDGVSTLPGAAVNDAVADLDAAVESGKSSNGRNLRSRSTSRK
jgi:hypothetical protein